MNKTITGTVISTKMQNTISILTEKKFRHPLYRKIIVRHKKIKAHCEDSSIREGDLVIIQETKPISKDKHFILLKKIKDKESVAQEIKSVIAEEKAVAAQAAEINFVKEVKNQKSKVKNTTQKEKVKQASKKTTRQTKA